MKKKKEKKLLICRSMEYLCNHLPGKMPSAGPCNPFFVCFDFPGTRNEAHLCVQCDASDASQRRLITRIRRSGTDLCMMNYMMSGSLDEILAYLADQENMTPLLESLQHLSDKMDDRD